MARCFDVWAGAYENSEYYMISSLCETIRIDQVLVFIAYYIYIYIFIYIYL